MSQPASALPGPGVTNRAAFKDISITKRVDKASPKLFLACAGGTNIAEVELVLRYPGGTNQVEYLEIKLQDVIVSSVKAAGTATSGDALPLEEVSFNYAKIRMTYQAVDESGAPSGPPVIGSWDIVLNQPQ
jgi:type VI secretion system secreted protein Hcp